MKPNQATEYGMKTYMPNCYAIVELVATTIHSNDKVSHRDSTRREGVHIVTNPRELVNYSSAHHKLRSGLYVSSKRCLEFLPRLMEIKQTHPCTENMEDDIFNGIVETKYTTWNRIRRD